MYVCICKGVSDRTLRAAVAEGGARSWREVREETGCGSQCGKCARVGKSIVREAIIQEVLSTDSDLAYAV
ncbi:(2Fe-2S)-binding protein [Pistricoccus aurantiacus]|uniref:Bacterioferritin-associated ferredoxin n=1 Tax=Pistricoccus aurantiacus TaxID=1883414 RepID=A0A5B8SM66_9GAMM|nr:(2Fe-2S)-binding protein [Pistricoccus aurantiacus]QEA37826.1 (2Fe-2S)-binding protein [Pistricoccus aurantiacus]